MEQATIEQSKKRRRGGQIKPEHERLVLIAGRVPPATRQAIESICQSRDWKISDAIKAACELLVKQERKKVRKNIADVNDCSLTC